MIKSWHDFDAEPIVKGKLLEILKIKSSSNREILGYRIEGYELPIKGVRQVRGPFEKHNVKVEETVHIEHLGTRTSMNTRKFKVLVDRDQRVDVKKVTEPVTVGSAAKK